jgi:outer membrane protein OmpA-like peptidoglycan-associated protein
MNIYPKRTLFFSFCVGLVVFLLLLVSRVGAQQSRKEAPLNLVPNPGFEKFIGTPDRWFYRGADFALTARYWFSATTASPDAYGPGIKVPYDWAEKGFGNRKPRSGKNMAGITVFGCTDGKPHCREYIQIQLTEPLVVGQNYLFECWVSPLDRSMYINNIGAYMSINPIRRTTDEVLVREAQVASANILKPAKPGAWMKISGIFQAKYPAEHLLIGNFNDDEHTLSTAVGADVYNYAYYYIDDVLLQKAPPYLTVPVPDDDLTKQKMAPGKSFLLKNIYFEFDRHELMPRSFVELKKLLGILTKYPTMTIEIVGNTDNVGNDAYNTTLSQQRAQSVVNYLVENHVHKNRLRVRGEGEKKPISTNETEEGRQLNRRVEFVVLKM